MTEKQASSEIAQSRERFLDEISKQMGDAGYCNYAACRTFLARAMDEAEGDTRELKAALLKYGKHLTACACFDEFDEKACDCGFGKYELG